MIEMYLTQLFYFLSLMLPADENLMARTPRLVEVEAWSVQICQLGVTSNISPSIWTVGSPPDVTNRLGGRSVPEPGGRLVENQGFYIYISLYLYLYN